MLNFLPPMVKGQHLLLQRADTLIKPPRVGLLNFPPRPLPPGAMFAGFELGGRGIDLFFEVEFQIRVLFSTRGRIFL